MFGRLNRRNKARIQARVITTSLSYQQILDLAATTAENIPPKRTITGKHCHRLYTHKRTKKPTIGFGHLDKKGQMGVPDWSITIARTDGGATMQVTFYYRQGGDVREGREIDRFYDRFSEALTGADAESSIEVKLSK